MKNYPLVSFVLYAYNEEKFIREAVESALAQDYSPLEIVLSDDGSVDCTFSIMQEMAAAYQGPHKIILNRNEKNIGIGSQLNAAVQKTKGELILLANGDDESRSNRVARTVGAWVSSGKRASAVVCKMQLMDEGGTLLLDRYIKKNAKYASLEKAVANRMMGIGQAAALALSRDVFVTNPPLMPALILEDNSLNMRAMMIGDILHIDEVLVNYRVHRENISQAYSGDIYEAWVKRFDRTCLWQRKEATKVFTQMLFDLYCAKDPHAKYGSLEKSRFVAIEKIFENELCRQFYDGQTVVSHGERWGALWRLFSMLSRNTLKSLIPALKERSRRKNYELNIKARGE